MSKKSTTKKSATKKSATKKSATKKSAAKKSATKKSAAKKSAAKKSAAKKSAAKKAAAKKSAAKKAAAKKASTKAASKDVAKAEPTLESTIQGKIVDLLTAAGTPIPLSVMQSVLKVMFPGADAPDIVGKLVVQTFAGGSEFEVVHLNGQDFLQKRVMAVAATIAKVTEGLVRAAMKAMLNAAGGTMPTKTLLADIQFKFENDSDATNFCIFMSKFDDKGDFERVGAFTKLVST